MSDSDLLAIRLFIGSLAATALAVAMTQAQWFHRLFVASMFGLAAMLALMALGWPILAPMFPPLQESLAFIVSSRAVWFLIGAAFVAIFLPQTHKWRQRSPFSISLERDSGSDQYGIQVFQGISYVQLCVSTSQDATRCRAWYRRSDYSEDGIVPFALEHNEKHPLRWSKAGGRDPFEIDLRVIDGEVRVNVAVVTADHLQFEPDPSVGTPSNLMDRLQRIGVHRFQISIVGIVGTKSISSDQYLFIHWGGPQAGITSVRREPIK